MRTILAVDKAGPDLAVTVDNHVLGRIAGHGDDGQIRRRETGSGSTGGGVQRTGSIGGFRVVDGTQKI